MDEWERFCILTEVRRLWFAHKEELEYHYPYYAALSVPFNNA